MEKVAFVGIAKPNGNSCRARATSSPNAVHVRFRFVRKIEIENVRDPVHIQSARGDIGGDQDARVSCAESRQSTFSLALGLVSVDGHRADSSLHQHTAKTICMMFGAYEYEGARDVFLRQKMFEQRGFSSTRHAINKLLGERDGGRNRRYHNFDGMMQQRLRQVRNFAGHRRGKHQCLAWRRQRRRDLTDGRNESHIQHAIRLIEHQNIHLAQHDDSLLHQVQQSPRSRHQDIHATMQGAHLIELTHAAIDSRVRKSRMPSIRGKALADLRRQLACGR